MDKVVNWFILLLIFVFDPLAVALVYAANKVSEIDEQESEDRIEKLPKTPILNSNDYEDNLSKLDKTNENIIESNIEKSSEPEHIDEPSEINELDEIEESPEHIEPEHIEPEHINEEIKIEEQVEKPKIKLEDIKEIKLTNRGFSKDIPLPNSNNSIQRIGNNKYVKNNENDKLYYKKKR
jgi:hypothetical protein